MSAMRCVIYARYSSDLQKDTSIDDQVRNCRESVKDRGWRAVGQQVYADRAVSGASIAGRRELSRLMDHAAQSPRPFDYVVVDDTSRLSRSMGEMDFFTPEEIRLFLDNVNPVYYTLFLTAVMTGVRRGELLALQWGDIDWNSNQISVRRSIYRGELVNPKSKNSIRRIVITPILRQALERHRLLGRKSELGLMFSQESGLPLDPDNLINREFKPALDRAGLRRIRFHDLRHSYASLLISQGENIKFIQSQLGHSSAKTTLDRYGHLMPDLENDAARRLDKTVFGSFVRKLLENPVSEGKPTQNKIPEAVRLQGLKFGSGERI